MGLFGKFIKNKIKGKYDFLNKIEYLKLFTGLSDKEIKSYSHEFKEKFKIEFPKDIKDFLKVTNGAFGRSGEYFLAKFNNEIQSINPRIMNSKTYDIIERNEEYRMMTDIEDFILLGEDSLSYFVYDIESKKYRIISNGTLDIMKEYNDLCTLIKEVLEEKIYE